MAEKKRRVNASGPSGKNQVPQRAIRIPDDLWDEFGEMVTTEGGNRNAVVNQLIAEYVEKRKRG